MSFQIIRNDITKVKADAIVNSANPKPVYGGGTDSAIYEAAGIDNLLAEREKIGNIERGQAVATPAFNLDAKYIIHTVGPVWDGGESGEFDILKNCYENSLKLALSLKCESIAFPLIATGVYGFPKDKALQIAMAAIQAFLLENEMQVILVVFDKASFELSGNVVDRIREYVSSNYVEEVQAHEYYVDMAAYNEERCDSLADDEVDRRPNIDAPWYNDERSANKEAPWYDEEASIRSRRRRRLESSVGLSNIRLDNRRDRKASAAKEHGGYAPSVSHNISMPPKPPAASSPSMEREAYSASSPSPAPAPRAASPQPYTKVDIGKMVGGLDKTFQEKLFEIIDERGLTGPQVYKNYITKQVYSKIQSDRNYHPNKFTAIALCLSLHLDVDQTQDLIGRAGWTLSPSNKADIVVKGCIMNKEYNLYNINCILFDFECLQLERIK